MSAANMAVTYRKVPVQTTEGESVPGLFAIKRIEDGLILPSVGVGAQYDVLQPLEAFAFFQPFLDAGNVILDTAGILRNGSRFFVNASIQNAASEIVPGDAVRGYLLFYTSVDGSLVTNIKYLVTRVVCANTAAAALREDAPRIRVKHTKGQRVALEAIQDVMDFQSRSFSATVAQYRRLAQTPVLRADLNKYIRIVLDFPSEEEASTKANNIVERVMDLAESGQGTEIAGTRGTAWGAFNALTEYLNHEAGRNEWSREDSLLFGEYSKVADRALIVANEVLVDVR
jgi:phage/plasmid-like protein (TIGR03299 family)